MIARRKFLAVIAGWAVAAACGRGRDRNAVVPGRLYVVASPDGTDAPDRDRLSFPAEIVAEPMGRDTWRVETVVGPLDRDYRGLSVVWEIPTITPGTYGFGGVADHEVGCDARWEPRPGATGAVSAIPQWCAVDGARVGLARARRTAGARIVGLVTDGREYRREPQAGDWLELWVVRHTGLAGVALEVSFQPEPLTFAPPRPAGAVLTLTELLRVIG